MALTLGAGLVGLPLLWRDAGPIEEGAESAHRLDLAAPAPATISRTPLTMLDPRPIAGGDMRRFAEGAFAPAPQADVAAPAQTPPRAPTAPNIASQAPQAPVIASVEADRSAPMPPRRPAELALAAPTVEPLARPRFEPVKPPASAKDAAQTSTPPSAQAATQAQTNDAGRTQETAQSAVSSPESRRQGRARRYVASRTAPKTQANAPSFFERLFGGLAQQPGGAVMAYAPVGGALDDRAASAGGASSLSRQAALPRQTPSLDLTPRAAPSLGGGRAIYDISAQMVYLPDGTRLEAHSGLGEHRDSVASRHIRMRGVTPPHVYNLTEREALFHGVRAIRLNPVGGSGAIFGRAGLLAHTYMLGPNGDSNGCVSIRDYNVFLRAFLSGQIRQLVVVDSMRNLPSQFAQR